MTVRVEAVVVARVEVPTAIKVPCVVRDEVAVIDPPVIDPARREEMVPVIALRVEAKKLVEEPLVAIRLDTNPLVVVEFPTMRFVIFARVATRLEMKELVLVLLVMVPLRAVRADIDVVANTD